MQVNLVLVLTTAVLCGAGVYLMLERSLTRVLVGLLLLSNGAADMQTAAGEKPGQVTVYSLQLPRAALLGQLTWPQMRHRGRIQRGVPDCQEAFAGLALLSSQVDLVKQDHH